MAENFTAQVSSWCARSLDRVKKVRDQSALDLINNELQARGKVPFRTGWLWHTGETHLNGVLAPLVGHPGEGTFSWDGSQTLLTIKGATLADTITFSYGAVYAVFVEYGTVNFEGRRWVGMGCQKWPQIVEANCQLFESRVGG